MLKITKLKYSYKEKSQKYDYDFSLHVNKGEIVGIIGKSGSGKSTLLDLIAGFLTPISGEIKFKNQDITTLEVEKRPLTILFQNYNIFEHLTVLQNVLLGIKNSFTYSNEEKNRAKEILKELGLEGFEDKKASKLSGGEAQRVALARSLLRSQPILLLDEPFSALDYQTKEKILELVKRIALKNGLYVLMVTHDLNDCKKIANRVYEVKDGKTVAI
ncbi:ATP-binding cassette domain-containing protein [Sulfurospirillum sp. 1307]|jgi:thiamine transport system ATP-binding protein